MYAVNLLRVEGDEGGRGGGRKERDGGFFQQISRVMNEICRARKKAQKVKQAASLLEAVPNRGVES